MLFPEIVKCIHFSTRGCFQSKFALHLQLCAVQYWWSRCFKGWSVSPNLYFRLGWVQTYPLIPFCDYVPQDSSDIESSGSESGSRSFSNDVHLSTFSFPKQLVSLSLFSCCSGDRDELGSPKTANDTIKVHSGSSEGTKNNKHRDGIHVYAFLVYSCVWRNMQSPEVVLVEYKFIPLGPHDSQEAGIRAQVYHLWPGQ